MELSEIAIERSMLVYLLSSMICLGATGQFATDHQFLNIDRDDPRYLYVCATELALCSEDRAGHFQCSAVTGAPNTAAFLFEVSCEAEQLKKHDQSSLHDDEKQSKAFLVGIRHQAATNINVLLNHLRGFYKTDLATDVLKV